MTDAQNRALHGWAEVLPASPVVAGTTGTWRVVYHAGRRGIDDGGAVKFMWRDASDWGAPQFDDPPAPDYATPSTSSNAMLRARFGRRDYSRPWRPCTTVTVSDGWLQEGDTLTLTLGDTSAGGPGSRAQTFAEEAFEIRVAVDWSGTWQHTEVPSGAVAVVNGPPARLGVVGPTAARVGESTWIALRVEDQWGNPCLDFTGTVELDGRDLQGLPRRYVFAPADHGVHRFDGVVASQPGIYRVSAVSQALSATGSPLVVRESGPVTARAFWGDLHGQSVETGGSATAWRYFDYARDAACVDFAGIQGNDLIISEEVWRLTREAANGHDDPGRFVSFVGWEWSGNPNSGGDRNVYFAGDDGPLHRSSRVLVPDPPRADGSDRDARHVDDLFAALRGSDALLVPHVGGRRANLDFHDPALEPVIEVLSGWGEFEWFLRDAIERGYQVGFVCGGDDHKGRPGEPAPGRSFAVHGGLACIEAPQLSRAALLRALRARRCYGTSGARIAIRASADGHPIGAAFRSDAPPSISVEVSGTAPIECIDLFRGTEHIARRPESIPRSKDTVRVSWRGARHRDRGRTLRWDGDLSIENGRIVTVEGWAFDSPDERILETTERACSWRSSTAGDADGLTLTVEGGDDATISFETDVVSHKVTLGAIRGGCVDVEGNGLEARVRFEMSPTGVGLDYTAEFSTAEIDAVSPEREAGPQAYWLRVRQIDGHTAWVSPFYVTIDR